jgi:Family of unknown function (DUF6194)
MDQETIGRYLTETFADVQTASADGATFFFYGTERMLPFATLMTKDDVYDRASNLDRPGVFRLNIGVARDTYRALFGPAPARAGAGGAVDSGHDFTALDQLMPHPVYAPQSWVCVLNPSETTFEKVKPLLAEAYALAVKRQQTKSKTDSTGTQGDI